MFDRCRALRWQRFWVFDSRAPAPVLLEESMKTGIDGLRRGVRWSRVRDEFGQAALIDGSGDPSGMVCVCSDGGWMLNRYDTLCMLSMCGESEGNRLLFNRTLGIACFSSERLYRLSDRRRLVGEPDSVECHLICLEGTIGTRLRKVRWWCLVLYWHWACCHWRSKCRSGGPLPL